ncbi:glutaredoxin type 1 [Rozella allomycis CSF55]|uniref:Glutaredoxin type 1 n=1 Tax=Rozella allomycis (strain CSF55) TaxID=988480 RepID=A0A075B2E9_ROZAC|nr:Glutaredoxin, eukaryotic/virial domain-containing protein [Rozella allomycis CSF55]RKP16650.1 glutaredoxin type 1 [Rozella allomycis CSF55]|eukprot:EPZ36542.1 Glutaredoxin, eukaryotic/virial domain-containing protein [Rozella allomycis CSF55]
MNALVKKLIAENNVMIFSKSYCPYCKKAKKLFENINVSYFALELDQESNGSEIQNELAKMTGQTTVPNIFIKGNHLGGCDDTYEAFNSGKLQKLLKE